MLVKTKDLRTRTAKIIKAVKKGEEVTVTYRGEPVAVIQSISKTKKSDFKPLGFGMWANREDLKDVDKWIRERRKARYEK